MLSAFVTAKVRGISTIFVVASAPSLVTSLY